MQNESFYKLIKPIIILLYIVIGIYAFKFVMDYVLRWVLPFIIGFLLSRMALPLRTLMINRFRMKDKLASVLATTLVLVLFLGLVVGIIFFLYQGILPFLDNLEQLYEDLSAQLSQTGDRLMEYFSSLPEALRESLEEAMKGIPRSIDFAGLIGGPLLRAAGNVPLFLLSIIATLVSAFFFVIDNKRIRNFVTKLIKPDLYTKISRTYRHLFSNLFKWLKSQTILALICAVELLIGFLILGLKHPLLLAGIIAFVDFLPVLGAGGVLIPWALIAFILGNVKLAIGLLVLYVVILMVRNLVEPHVLGQQIGMHPLLTLFSIYLGFRMYGFLGMLIVPLLFITVIQLNQWGYIRLWRDKNTDSEEEALPPDSD